MITNPTPLSRRLLIALLAGGIAVTSSRSARSRSRRGGRRRRKATPAARNSQARQSASPPTSPPTRRSSFPAARCASRRPPARSRSTTAKASCRPRSPTSPIVLPDATRRRVPSPSCSMAAPARRRPICSSARMGPWRLPLDNIAPSSTADARAQSRDLARLHRPRVRRSGRHRLQPLHQRRATRCASSSGRSTATSTCSRPSCASGSRRTDARRRRNSSPARAMAASARRSSPASSTSRASAVSGLVMVSPVIDFGWRGNGRHSPLGWVARLPSMAAAAREANAPFDREALREVERYAAGDYLQDLLRGERDSAAVERMSARVAQLTGLDPALVRRLAGRVDTRTFMRERNRERGLIASMYDATVTGIDPDPHAASLALRRSGAQRHARAAVERDDRPLRARAELARGGAVSAAQRPGQLALGLGRRARRRTRSSASCARCWRTIRACACWSRTARAIWSRPISRTR